jgi:CO dehydrogenase maturation factor
VEDWLMERQIIKICGEQDVGKTVFCALLSRSMIDLGIQPLLLIDGDPTGDLALTIGNRSISTIGCVRDQLIKSMRRGETTQPVDHVDYLVTQCLLQRSSYSFLSVGQATEETWLWPTEVLLGASIDILVSSFSAILIDTGAGIKQIGRDGTRWVNQIIAVVDDSKKSLETLHMIQNTVNDVPVYVVIHAGPAKARNFVLPKGIQLLGVVPNNRQIQQFCANGRSLWELPTDNKAVEEVGKIARRLIPITLSASFYDKGQDR